MSELDRLIAEQERDDRFGHRVHGDVVDPLAVAHLLTPGRDGLPTLATRPAVAHDNRHGSLYCYVRLRCRCPRCRAASRDYQRARRRRAA